MTTPALGGGDFTTPVAIAASDVNLDAQAAVSVPAAGSHVFGPYTMTTPAYAVAVDALVPVAATIGIFKVVMTWTDAATGLQLGQETWHLAGTTLAPAATTGLTFGRGPTKANTLTVTVFNTDPAQAITVDWAVWQSSRIVTRDDWRGLASNGHFITYTTPSIEASTGLLGWTAGTALGVGASKSWLCALYAGAAFLTVVLTATAGVSVQVFSALADVAAVSWPSPWEGLVPASGLTETIALPRAPTVITVTNNGTVSMNVTWDLIIQEFAS